MKRLFYICLLVISINWVYSTTFISEIDFLDNEFVEIYSNISLNLTHKLLFDDAGLNNSNNLTLIQNKNFSFFLIVGQNFLDNYDYSQLNCSIYYSQKSGLGYRNLKNSGENITILINNQTNLTWIKRTDLNFQENQTLNYNQYNNSYFIKNKNPCHFPNLTISNINFSNINISNNSNNDNNKNNTENKKINNSNISIPKIEFQIILDKQIFENKIEFKFQTNATDYIIEYWIEDLQKNIVKNKYNTTNTNLKSFTAPKQTQIYKIFATLYFQNYTYNDSRTLTFYYFEPVKNISILEDNCQFDIDLKTDNFFQEKLKYSFITPKNETNYTIFYWIKDFQGEIIQDIKNTTNKNTKTYTPKTLSNIFNISANFLSKNCNVQTSKLAFFYKKYQQELTEENSSNRNRSLSYLKILNQQELKNFTTNILKYEIYKGDTLKRIINFYLNSRKISSFELEKFSLLKGEIELEYNQKINEIKIEGLDQQISLLIISNNNFTKNSKISQNKTIKDFQILNLTKNNSQIFFKIDTTIQNLTAECYINLNRTKISQSINLTKNNLNFTLQINNTKLISKINQNKYDLKLVCKYKKQELKTYKYEYFDFEYEILNDLKNQILLKNLLLINNLKNSNNSYNNNFNYTNSIQNPFQIFNKPEIIKAPKMIITKEEIKPTDKIDIKDNFESKNQKLSQNSYFGIFIGVVLILFILLIRW